jgi:hypothetical protein
MQAAACTESNDQARQLDAGVDYAAVVGCVQQVYAGTPHMHGMHVPARKDALPFSHVRAAPAAICLSRRLQPCSLCSSHTCLPWRQHCTAVRSLQATCTCYWHLAALPALQRPIVVRQVVVLV